MLERDNPKLAVEVGGQTVGARLDLAIEQGAVIRHEDGRLSVPQAPNAADGIGGGYIKQGWDFTLGVGDGETETAEGGGYSHKTGGTARPCTFLNDFLFDQAYGQGAVPLGCRDCYKIKATPSSLRALMAMKSIAEATPHATKSGQEIDNPTNQNLYGTYVYFRGLDQARKAYKGLRQNVDQHEHLGPDVAMTIKRGCSNYERRCGPSDQYAFDPRLEAVEAYLAQRFTLNRPPRTVSKEKASAMSMLKLIKTAYRIGDETYKDFTGGEPLYEPLVSYPPEADTPPTE
jgi:hypothetical protein